MPSKTQSNTASKTQSNTASKTPSNTPSNTASKTPSNTASKTPSKTASKTPSKTASPSNGLTPFARACSKLHLLYEDVASYSPDGYNTSGMPMQYLSPIFESPLKDVDGNSEFQNLTFRDTPPLFAKSPSKSPPHFIIGVLDTVFVSGRKKRAAEETPTIGGNLRFGTCFDVNGVRTSKRNKPNL